MDHDARSARTNWFIWFVWLVSFIWLNKTNQIDQMNQTDHPTEQRLADCCYAASDVSSVGFLW